MEWDDRADTLIVKLWNDGRTLTLIAEEMRKAGYADLTRNMVAGRKHRMSPALFHRPRKPPTQTRLPQRSKQHVTMTQELKDSVEPPEVEGIEYLAMRDHHCKATLDRRDKHWGLPLICGKPRTKANGVYSSSYCAFHLHAFHNVPGQRR